MSREWRKKGRGLGRALENSVGLMEPQPLSRPTEGEAPKVPLVSLHCRTVYVVSIQAKEGVAPSGNKPTQ